MTSDAWPACMRSHRAARLGAAVALCAATLPAGPGRTQEDRLRAGTYEVSVNLELPHLEGMGATRTAHICLEGANPTHGLGVLSENNPLRACPAFNVREEAGQLKFEVHCEGKNAAQGLAAYTLRDDSFDGRIVMKMGGKNMTMTETQKGRRTGPCSAPTNPPS